MQNQATADVRPAQRNRAEGYVVECDGMHAVIAAKMSKDDSATTDYWAVGMLLSIVVDNIRIVGMLYKVEARDDLWDTDGSNVLHIHVELVGEITTNEKTGKTMFSGGLSVYPHLGAVAHRIRRADLAAVFENDDASAVRIGSLSQNDDIPAMLSINSLISRHFAVVGTTGVGKSTSVSLLIRKIIESRPDVRILILDPHNEFISSFPDVSIAITDRDLDLPFWTFRLEEFVEVIFRGRDPVPEEVDMLRDLIPLAKAMFKGEQTSSVVRKTHTNVGGLTADTAVPYRMSDLIALLDERLGKLGNSEQKSDIKALMARIKSATSDPRYRFMFSSKTIEDNLSSILGRIFRVPLNNKPITTFQLNGIPSEVVNAVVSVLCRMAFDLAVWSQSRIKTVVICEEAHRYIPANSRESFAPTRAAISRIAKEGRKYGVSLGIITQRPGELDSTILSQCNTVFSMRLGNDSDQDIMRKAISGASRSYINFLPSLANREAIAFGQGVSTPMRMTFETIPLDKLPGNHLASTENPDLDESAIEVNIQDVIRTMRATANTDDFEQEILGGAEAQYPIGGEAAPEQRPSIAAGAPQRPSAPADSYFTETAPLRRMSDQIPSELAFREGRRANDQVRVNTAPPAPSPSGDGGGGNSLISRFRR